MRKEQGMLHVHNLHLKYGPIVQLSPNELSITDLPIVRKIYLNDNYPKEFSHLTSNSKKIVKIEKGFYSQFGNFCNKNLFSTGDTREHINKKKPLQKIYSKTFVLHHSKFLTEKINNLVDNLVSSKNQNVDVYSLFGALAMDVVTGFEFGFNNSSNFLNESDFQNPNVTYKNDVFESFRDSSSLWFWVCMTPQLYSFVSKWSGKDKTMVIGRKWIWGKIMQVVTNYTAEDLKKQDCTISVLYDRYDRDLAKIGSELADHTLAGADTTQTTLTYLMWQLARPANKEWKEKLLDEVQSVFAIDPIDNHVIIDDYNKLDLQMPIMNAIIKENFRLHAAIPGSERRFVPNGEGLKVGGYKIKPGIVVSTQPYSLHRQNVFGNDLDEFKPERWLPFAKETATEYQDRIKEFERHMMTFGQGNRMCLGMHLAVTEIKACVASVFGNKQLKNYEICTEWCNQIDTESKTTKMGYGNKLIDKFKDRQNYLALSDTEKMRMADSYTIRPLFDECWMTI
ncbi:cytochrome P450 [Hanseniaspora valbyensis NRRL Y-1626]|uniref:Cytochrome P450 n=1 Tax=Hanseniaspora valbyensis NRRL Y-1626 TaxID=766949 RepID=A0A1B7THC7_9ASCO|nr:cytochrome P450 [Hanseniaspora valbyensis NRRL Y-1626]